jgi:hypothetical protein
MDELLPRTQAPVIWNRPATRWGPINAYWACDIPEGVPNIAFWLLHSPKTHAVWDYWMVSLIHLRDVPGVPAAVKQDPSHTHELLIFALQRGSLPPNPAEPQGFEALTPPDLVQGFVAASDAEAVSILERMLERFIDGHLPPDVDFARLWKRLLLTHPGGTQ